MQKPRKKLSTGIQSFETIVTENYIYVDKTRYLIDMIDTGALYFYARPRRFGKTLTVATLEAIFSGKKHLFEGLYAEEFMNRPDYKTHPVIRLNMSAVSTSQGIEAFQKSLKFHILQIADKLGIEVSDDLTVGDMLSQIIQLAAKKYNANTVVLVDEYDKPYTDFINDLAMAEKIRNFLRDFYVQLKANEEYIRFIFITGISKFTKMGIFSTLNNIVDISPDIKYGEMVGLTEDEIVKYFSDYVNETANKFGITNEALLQKMRDYYDGFCFDISGKARLYNPFSTLYFFQRQEFFNFWFESATPSMLAKYMKDRYLTVEQFRNFPVSMEFLNNSVEIEKAEPENFLYQSGYLSLRPGTIDDFELDYPNTEVLNSMSALISKSILTDKDEDFSFCRTDFIKSLQTANLEKMAGVFNRLLASIPYDDFAGAARQSISNNDFDFSIQEWLYRSTILAFFRGCGVATVAEMHTNLGRADLVVTHKGRIYVIEIKVAKTPEEIAAKLAEAENQIIENNYTAPYENATAVAVVIDDTIRQVVECKRVLIST